MNSGTDFYNTISIEYDCMTNAKNRIENEFPFFENLLKKYGFRSAVDIGCGTGHHLKILAELQIQTHGIDPSEEMLRIANENLKGLDRYIRISVGDFNSIPEQINEQMDAVFCQGNTLPHLLTEDKLYSAVANVRKILNPGGIFVIHLINYSRVLAEKKKIVNVS